MSTARLSLNPVGQGLFYDGSIGNFKFVYDCGGESESALNYAIDNYIKDLPINSNKDSKKQSDLLVLSHFHYDHISGLKKLLSAVRFKYVVLPYLSPIERLELAIMRPNEQLDYYEFLRDPIKFLGDNNLDGEIVIISGNEPDRKKSEKSPYNGDNESRPPENDFIKFDMQDDPDTSKLVEKNEENWLNNPDYHVSVKSHAGYLRPAPLWVFRFFNFKIPREKLIDLENCVKSVFGFPSNEGISNKKIKEIISVQEKRRELAKCYKQKFRKEGLNVTSLIAFHGPTRRLHTREKRLTILTSESGLFSSTFLGFPPRCHNEMKGHFLTGDAEFQGRWSEIKQHFSLELPRMSGILLPHHGSNKNGADILVSKVKSQPVFYLSAGIGNKHGHPHPDVVESVIRNGRSIIWSNQFCRVSEFFDYP